MKISSISCTPPFQFSCATNIIHTVTASRNDGYVDRLLRNLHGARQSRAGKTFLHRNIGYVHPHANGVKSQCQDPDVIRVGGEIFIRRVRRLKHTYLWCFQGCVLGKQVQISAPHCFTEPSCRLLTKSKNLKQNIHSLRWVGGPRCMLRNAS